MFDVNKGPFQSRDSEKGGGNALSHYVQTKLRIRAAVEWRVEWAHVSEEVLNDNNNALRGRARNNSEGEGKKAVSCFERRVAVRERQKEARSRGEVGVLSTDRKFQQKKLARVLTTLCCANGYAQTLMSMHARSQIHIDTDLFCSSLSTSPRSAATETDALL